MNIVSPIVAFIRRVGSSIYSPSFYAKVPGERFVVGLTYLNVLVFLASLYFSFTIIPALFTTISSDTIRAVINYIPAELEVTIGPDGISTNQTEPYYIPMSGKTAGEEKNFVVFDTKSDFTLEQFESYSTYVLVKKNYIVSASKQGTKITPIKNIEKTTVVSRSVVQSWADKLTPYLMPFNVVVSLFMIVLVYLCSLAGRMIGLLVFTVPVWLYAKIRKMPLTYGNAYKISMHAITFTFIIAVVCSALSVHFAFWTEFLLFCLMVVLNIRPGEVPLEAETA